MYQNFTEKLMEAKRRARLMGRPLQKSEVAGITAGYASGASDRLARRKQLSLQERGLDIQERGMEEEMRVAGEARRAERRQSTLTGIGAGVGALVGSTVPGVGTWLGATIGGGLGSMLGGGCIIISACTDPDSYEVNIAREYRDGYMSLEELIGYYTLARLIVPIMPKKLIKRFLVDRLVDYGEVILGKKASLKFTSSYWITTGFLKLCEGIGGLYIRRRMEVYE